MNFRKLPKQEEVEEIQAGNMSIRIIENTPENHEHVMDAILKMYENEPCRICGELIDDARKAVYAGYSKDSKSRSAHKACWNKNIPQAQWAYPESAPS
jgi:hypothetical protein